MIAIPAPNPPYQLKHVEKIFGISFSDFPLYMRALTTPAYQALENAHAYHHARLAFRGKAILADKVVGYLARHTGIRVPILAAIAKRVQRNASLALVGSKIGLRHALRISRQEERHLDANTRHGRKVQADAIRALIAAVSQEHDPSGLDIFLRRYIFPQCDILLHRSSHLAGGSQQIEASLNGTALLIPARLRETRSVLLLDRGSKPAMRRSLGWLDL